MNGIKARYEYCGLELTCDEEAFSGLRDLIWNTPAVAKATDELRGVLDVHFIIVRKPTPPVATARCLGWWLSMMATGVGIAVSSVTMIIGYFDIVKWLMALLS